MEYLSRFNGNAEAQLAKNRQITFGRAHSPRGKRDPPTLNLYLALHVFIKIDFHNKWWPDALLCGARIELAGGSAGAARAALLFYVNPSINNLKNPELHAASGGGSSISLIDGAFLSSSSPAFPTDDLSSLPVINFQLLIHSQRIDNLIAIQKRVSTSR